jgi:hypothetical protein
MVSLLFNPETAPFADGYLHSAQAAAPTLGATVIAARCGSVDYRPRLRWIGTTGRNEDT